MRALMILGYYALVSLFGFWLRGRYGEFLYRTPHMQRRLRRWGAQVARPAAAAELVLPPSTLDATAFRTDEAVDLIVVPPRAGEAPAASVAAGGPSDRPPPSIDPR